MGEYKLTCKVQCSEKCPDGKSRNFLLYFLNDVLILKQKFPYDADYSKGYDKRTEISDEFLLNGKLYQTRKGEERHGLIDNHYWSMIKQAKIRQVKYPISKKRLEKFEIPMGLKIDIE